MEAGSAREAADTALDSEAAPDTAADIGCCIAVDKERCRGAEAAGTRPGPDLEVGPDLDPGPDTARTNCDRAEAADPHLAAEPDPAAPAAAETGSAGQPDPKAPVEGRPTCPRSNNPDPARLAVGCRLEGCCEPWSRHPHVMQWSRPGPCRPR